MTFGLSESETERYDRQIRVWGAEAQTRIQTSKALICGMNKINVEVVKNIVLAGVNLTIQDSGVVTFDELAYNFFLNVDDIGKQIATTVLPRVKELNSFASVDCNTSTLDDLDDTYFTQFSVILMSGCSEAQSLRINNLCRQRSPQAVFFWSDVFGEEALFYSDFGDNFQYKDDATATAASSSSSTSSSTPVVKPIKSITFPSLHSVLTKSWKDIPVRFFPLSPTFVKHRLLTKFRDEQSREPTVEDESAVRAILTRFQSEYGLIPAPISSEDKVTPNILSDVEIRRLCAMATCTSVLACSVLGSFLSQEVIKAVSMTGAPGYNVFVFTGEDLVTKAIPI